VALDTEAWPLACLAFRYLVVEDDPLAFSPVTAAGLGQQKEGREQQQRTSGAGAGKNLLAAIGGVGGKGNTTKLISCLRRLLAAVLAESCA
jgi:hypothetical protein